MRKSRILVVDDDAALRFAMTDFLSVHGYLTEQAANCQQAEEALPTFVPDAIVVDYAMPDGNALELLPRVKAVNAEIPVVILTGHGSIDLAVRAIKEGADQFLTKPLELPALLVVLERVLENQRNRQREEAGRSRQARQALDPFQGTSAAIRALADEARRVAESDRSVLIQGETGCGKGVLARWLHENGPRAQDPFVDLNCAGLSRELLETEIFGHEKGAFTGAAARKSGLLEIAHRGTFFLDEIGDMDLQVQPKLLTAVEEKRFRRLGDVRDRTVDVRLVAATHQDLAQLVREKRFRSDLYFRINALRLEVPPLRRRAEDVPALAQRLLEQLSAEMGRPELRIDEGATAALQNYAWPGNVRELKNVLERAALFAEGDRLSPRHLQFEKPAAAGEPPAEAGSAANLAEIERSTIERVLREEGGHVESAAARLGISRSSLYSKLKAYGLTPSRI